MNKLALLAAVVLTLSFGRSAGATTFNFPYDFTYTQTGQISGGPITGEYQLEIMTGGFPLGLVSGSATINGVSATGVPSYRNKKPARLSRGPFHPVSQSYC
jgi:hypothetical protein